MIIIVLLLLLLLFVALRTVAGNDIQQDGIQCSRVQSPANRLNDQARPQRIPLSLLDVRWWWWATPRNSALESYVATIRPSPIICLGLSALPALPACCLSPGGVQCPGCWALFAVIYAVIKLINYYSFCNATNNSDRNYLNGSSSSSSGTTSALRRCRPDFQS